MPPTPGPRRCARSCATTSPAGSGQTRSASTRTSGCSPDGLLGVLLPASRRPATRVQPGARVPEGERGRRQPERVRLTARPPLPGAEAVGHAALLRPRGTAGDHPRARAAGGAVRAVGRRGAGLGALRSPPLLARLLPAGSAATRRTPRSWSVSTTAVKIFLSHTKLDDRFVLRLAIGNARTSEADVGLAWDVLARGSRGGLGLGLASRPAGSGRAPGSAPLTTSGVTAGSPPRSYPKDEQLIEHHVVCRDQRRRRPRRFPARRSRPPPSPARG